MSFPSVFAQVTSGLGYQLSESAFGQSDVGGWPPTSDTAVHPTSAGARSGYGAKQVPTTTPLPRPNDLQVPIKHSHQALMANREENPRRPHSLNLKLNQYNGTEDISIIDDATSGGGSGIWKGNNNHNSTNTPVNTTRGTDVNQKRVENSSSASSEPHAFTNQHEHDNRSEGRRQVINGGGKDLNSKKCCLDDNEALVGSDNDVTKSGGGGGAGGVITAGPVPSSVAGSQSQVIRGRENTTSAAALRSEQGTRYSCHDATPFLSPTQTPPTHNQDNAAAVSSNKKLLHHSPLLPTANSLETRSSYKHNNEGIAKGDRHHLISRNVTSAINNNDIIESSDRFSGSDFNQVRNQTNSDVSGNTATVLARESVLSRDCIGNQQQRNTCAASAFVDSCGTGSKEGVASKTRPRGSQHNLEKSALLCHTDNEDTLLSSVSNQGGGVSKSTDASVSASNKRIECDNSMDDMRAHTSVGYRPNSWASETFPSPEASKTNIAIDAERIIEQTRRLSSTALNNLDVSSDLYNKPDLYNKKFNFETSERSKVSPESNIESNILPNEHKFGINEKVLSDSNIVQGRLSFPVDLVKQSDASVKIERTTPAKAEHQQATKARLLAAKQAGGGEYRTGDVMAAVAKQPPHSLYQEQHSQLQQKRNHDPPTCKFNLHSQSDMGGIFSKGRTRGSSQAASAPNTPLASTVNSAPLKTVRLRERPQEERSAPSYVSQKAEPFKRHSGFSHVTSDNVRRMRDVWGSRQEKPPLTPGTPPSIRNSASSRATSAFPRFTDSELPVTSRRNQSPVTLQQRSPSPQRRSGTPTNVSERLRRRTEAANRTASNSPSGRVPNSSNSNISRGRTSPSPSRSRTRQENKAASQTANTIRNQTSPQKENNMSYSSASYNHRLHKNSPTPPSTPTRKTFSANFSPSPEKERRPDANSSYSNSSRKNLNNGSSYHNCKSSTSRESRSPTKTTSRTSTKPRAPSAPTGSTPTTPTPRPSSKPRAPAAPTATSASSNRQGTSRSSPPTENNGRVSSKARSESESKPAPAVHKRIFKRFRDASLRPDSETLCFVEKETKYKVSYDYRL